MNVNLSKPPEIEAVKPGMLQSMVWQKVGYNLATIKLKQVKLLGKLLC